MFVSKGKNILSAKLLTVKMTYAFKTQTNSSAMEGYSTSGERQIWEIYEKILVVIVLKKCPSAKQQSPLFFHS